MKKFQEGNLYKIRFYDHCIGMKEEMVCEVVGWVLHNTAKSVTLTHWILRTGDEETKKHNVEYTNILKSCIISKRKL